MAKKNRRKSWKAVPTDDLEEEISKANRRQSWRIGTSGVIAPEVIQKQRKLEQFLLNIPIKRLRGTTWKYFDISPQEGYSETLLMLHGGGVRAEAMFEHILGLATSFRVIAPLFPEQFGEMEDYVAGLALIMRHENIKKANFFGLAFGAVVAHHFMYRHPSRVLSAVFVHAIFPEDGIISQKAIKKVEERVNLQGTALKQLTGYLVKGKDIEEQLDNLAVGEKEMFMNMLKKFTASKQSLCSRLQALSDLTSKYSYSTERFQKWDGKLLLVESDKCDECYDEANFTKLTNLHPQAKVHFIAGGYLSPLLRAKPIVEIVQNFLLSNDDFNIINDDNSNNNNNNAEMISSNSNADQQNANTNTNNNTDTTEDSTLVDAQVVLEVAEKTNEDEQSS